jgi:hypothetical protein
MTVRNKRVTIVPLLDPAWTPASGWRLTPELVSCPFSLGGMGMVATMHCSQLLVVLGKLSSGLNVLFLVELGTLIVTI